MGTTERMHRKNMAQNSGSSCIGVDLNRNFDVNWSGEGASSNPCSDIYYGSSAASEPETRVLVGVLNEAPNTVYIDVHSYSQLIISSYAYTSAVNPRASEYRQIGSLMQDAIRQVAGITYQEGPVSEVLYVASGGGIDYADEVGALGICIEMRPSRAGGGGFAGFAPPVSEILPDPRRHTQGSWQRSITLRTHRRQPQCSKSIHGIHGLEGLCFSLGLPSLMQSRIFLSKGRTYPSHQPDVCSQFPF